MMYRYTFHLLVSFFFFFISLCVSAKDNLVKCGGTFEYIFQKNISIEQAEYEAVEYAKIQAIGQAFGINISQQAISETMNDNDSFDQITETLVRGQWVKDLKEPKLNILPFNEHGIGTIQVTVSFLAKEILRDKSITLHILRNGTTDNCEDNIFYGCDMKTCSGQRGDGGDDLYMSLVSRKDGYVAIFMKETDKVTCMLPYFQNEKEPFKIRKGERYVFFEKGEGTDTYHLMCDGEPELNYVYLLFSPNKFIDGDLLREMHIKHFRKWLGKMQSYDDQMEVVGPVMIKINPYNH